MPIRPENKDRYPKNWKEIRTRILVRAGEIRIDNKITQEAQCEYCKSVNHQPHYETGSIVVLTIAHLDHIPENCEDSNLRAWCQKCHNSYDSSHRAETRKTTKRIKIESELKDHGKLF